LQDILQSENELENSDLLDHCMTLLPQLDNIVPSELPVAVFDVIGKLDKILKGVYDKLYVSDVSIDMDNILSELVDFECLLTSKFLPQGTKEDTPNFVFDEENMKKLMESPVEFFNLLLDFIIEAETSIKRIQR